MSKDSERIFQQPVSGSDKLRRSTIAEAIEKLWLASPPHPPKNRKHTDAFVSDSDLEVQGDLQ
jgi:hypothetical protein